MLVNHVLQSTLFAAVVAALTLALKTNHARTRYWLWLAASLKFLIPFSVLVSLGGYFGSFVTPPTIQHSWMIVNEEIGRPFSQAPEYGIAAPAVHLSLFNMYLALGVVWFCGFAAVLYSWWKRWRRISDALRISQPVRAGRELEAIRRLQYATGIVTRVELAFSPASLEPGVFGILRQTLVLPAGISDHLSDAQLEAVLAHELCHVRWRDNLSATVHMFIEAVFWFHPLVWWLGARLVDERERACDEDVLRLGSEPSVYAESILRTCKFYLESPLVCVAGITGSNLKRRIEGIMTHRASLRLDFGRKLLLFAAALSAFAAPVTVGFLSTSLEVASIKPNSSGSHQARFLHSSGQLKTTNTTLTDLIAYAYDLRDRQIVGAPDWLNQDRYDIVAKTNGSPGDEPSRRLVQSILAQRFGLAVHRETNELPVYALMAGEDGPKFHESETPPDGPHRARIRMRMTNDSIEGFGVPMSMLARSLSDMTGRLVIDKTGLKGLYDFKVTASEMSRNSSVPTVFAAVQEQLGLKLEPQTGPVETLVIDRVEKPSAK